MHGPSQSLRPRIDAARAAPFLLSSRPVSPYRDIEPDREPPRDERELGDDPAIALGGVLIVAMATLRFVWGVAHDDHGRQTNLALVIALLAGLALVRGARAALGRRRDRGPRR